MTRTREENANDLAHEEREHDEDRSLSAAQLDDKYNQDGDGEHPRLTRDDWRDDVSNENTVSGYWDWLAHRLSEES